MNNIDLFLKGLKYILDSVIRPFKRRAEKAEQALAAQELKELGYRQRLEELRRHAEEIMREKEERLQKNKKEFAALKLKYRVVRAGDEESE